MKTDIVFFNYLFLLIIMIIKAEPQKKYCFTKLCQNTSERIRGYMNESVDPCENFYQFACGGFIENKTIPDEYGSVRSKLSQFIFYSKNLFNANPLSADFTLVWFVKKSKIFHL